MGIVLTIQLAAHGTNSQSLLEGNFDNFIAEVVVQEERHDFRLFYNDLVHNQQKEKLSSKEKDHEKLRKKITKLQEQGKISLEVRNPAIAYELKKSPDTKKKQKVHALFYRFGVYEEYLKNKANKQKSIVAKTKSYMRDAGNKVTAWFGNLRKDKTATT